MKVFKINNLDFAKNKQHISDRLMLKDLPRLKQALPIIGEKQDLSFSLIGLGNQYTLPSLNLSVNCALPLTCQRCLGSMILPLSLSFDYVVSGDEPEGYEEFDALEWLETDSAMDVIELVEDELLLAIPFAPTHNQDCTPAKLESGDKVSPFAVLKGKF
jgi:uncharacterized protein